MLYLVRIATLSAALSAGIVTAYGNARPEPVAGAKAFYDRLPQAGQRTETGLLRFVVPTDPRAS